MAAFLKHHMSVAACYAKLAVQRQLEYPLFLVSWFIMIPIQYFAGIWMLKIIVDRFQPLGGWDFPQLAFLFGLGLISHGVMVVFLIQSWHIDRMVIRGDFDRLLLQPMSVFFQFAASNINFIGLIDLIPGTIVFLYACKLVGFSWTLTNMFKLLLVIIGGTLIRAAIFTILGSVAFWTKRSGSLVDLTLTLFERTTMYPLSIYPYLVQLAFTFVIPIGFISFYPSTEFLGMDSSLSIPLDLALWSPMVGLAAFVIAHFVFVRGMRSYESAGS